jgi:bifunctional DNase/RNase
MIEVTIDDVIVRSPKAKPGLWLADFKHNTLGYWRIVLLRERAGARVLPIWLHPWDGDPIAMRLVGLAPIRPMPHDLITRLLQIGRLGVEKVAVTGLRGNIFYGSLWVRAGDEVHEIDVRPSDAMALALDCDVPVFVTEEAFRQAGTDVLSAGHELSELEVIHQRGIAEGRHGPDPEAREWCSFRTLPRHESSYVRVRAGRTGEH